MFDDLTNTLEYTTDEWKTEKKHFVTGLNCQPDTAYQSMKQALSMSSKSVKVLGYHGYQSFAENEVDAKTAHEIGVKLAQELWGNKFHVVVATHQNTKHMHNHFVLCSTSFVDGSRYHSCKASNQKIREVSDRLCREYGLSVIEHPEQGKSKHYAEWKAEQQGQPTWKTLIREYIDRIVLQSRSDKQFLHLLRQEGYGYKMGKYFTVRPAGKKNGIKLDRHFGEAYSMDGICKRILENHKAATCTKQEKKPPVSLRLSGKHRGRKKRGGFRALYLYYCYRLGAFPKKKPTRAVTHFLYREDMRKLETINKEARLLVSKRLDTAPQLLQYQHTVKLEIGELVKQRKDLRNQLRRTGGEVEKKTIRQKIAPLNTAIAEKRREVMLCDGILERSAVIREKIQTAEHKQQTEKEEKHHARRTRSIGTGF